MVVPYALGPRPIRVEEIRALESAAADGWPGLAREQLGGWLLTAGNGYTLRANSAVPLGDSDTPASLDAQMLRRLEQWYSQRGLPLRLRVPDGLASIPPGWRSWGETWVLALDIDNFVLPQGPSMVRVDPTVTPEWLALHQLSRADAGFTAPADLAVLTAVANGDTGFAALGLPTPLAIGRAAITTAPDGRCWVGLSCVAVGTGHRRHGLGTLVCAELIRWGHARGATHAYAAVGGDNAAALAMVADMGFLEHHRYVCTTPN